MSSLKSVFAKYREKKFLLVEPGGNWGDHLIYFGAEHLATTVGLQFESFTKDEFLALEEIKDVVIYIHGGGAFNEWCSDSGFRLLTRALAHPNNIVIYGPASCGENINFLEQKMESCFLNNQASKCYMFAREQKTYDIFKNLVTINSNCTLSKDVDTAFHLSKQAIIDRVGNEYHHYIFYGFREDNEAPNINHEKSLSEVVFDPAFQCTSFEHWMKVHLHAKKIVTNRTHSSIIGSILQKPTYLFNGSYHKNKSIWLEILKDKGVMWLEPQDAIGLVKNNWLDKLMPALIKNSWKVKNAFLKWKKVP